MAAPRYYDTTLLLGADHTSTGMLSVPKAIHAQPTWPLGIAAEMIQVETVRPVAAFELREALREVLQPVEAYVGPERAAPYYEALLFAPIIIVEDSPAVGRALTALLTTGGFAGIAYVDGSPVLLGAYGVACFFSWVVAPVVGGFRQGVHDAIRHTTHQRVERWLREHFEWLDDAEHRDS